MTESNVRLLENLLYQKILLYDDLRECFRIEREHLISIDLDKLWGISQQKDELCEQLVAIRQQIADLESEQGQGAFDSMLNHTSHPDRQKLMQLRWRLMKTKREIDVLRKENMALIDDSLKFMGEMVSILTTDSGSSEIYNDRCHVTASGPRSFLNREV